VSVSVMVLIYEWNISDVIKLNVPNHMHLFGLHIVTSARWLYKRSSYVNV